MFMYLREVEVVVRAGDPNAGTYIVREMVMADDAAQAVARALDRGRLAHLLSLGDGDGDGDGDGEGDDRIEQARIVACDEGPLPTTPVTLVSWLVPGRQMELPRSRGLADSDGDDGRS
jgi:hypothetical protein